MFLLLMTTPKFSKNYGMDKIITEEVVNKLDMFQYIFKKNRRIWLVIFINNFSRCRYAVYLHRVQIIMANSHCSFEVISYGTSGNKQTSQSDMENIAYNCTLTYGTCESFGSVYSFCINVNDRSYFSRTNN